MLQQPVEIIEEPKNSTLFIDNFLRRKYYTHFIEQPVEVVQEPKNSTVFYRSYFVPGMCVTPTPNFLPFYMVAL